MLLLALVFALVFPQPLAQEKPAVSFSNILACVQATNCKNMKPAKVSPWSDSFGFTGLVFDDAGWTYELYLSGPTRDDLSIQLKAPGEPRSSHLLALDKTGTLVQAQLSRPAGEPTHARFKTREELEASQQRRKSFVVEPRWPPGGTLGEESRPFWQKLADQSLEAIRRQIAR